MNKTIVQILVWIGFMVHMQRKKCQIENSVYNIYWIIIVIIFDKALLWLMIIFIWNCISAWYFKLYLLDWAESFKFIRHTYVKWSLVVVLILQYESFSNYMSCWTNAHLFLLQADKFSGRSESFVTLLHSYQNTAMIFKNPFLLFAERGTILHWVRSLVCVLWLTVIIWMCKYIY